jgi:hypothetical protein
MQMHLGSLEKQAPSPGLRAGSRLDQAADEKSFLPIRFMNSGVKFRRLKSAARDEDPERRNSGAVTYNRNLIAQWIGRWFS